MEMWGDDIPITPIFFFVFMAFRVHFVVLRGNCQTNNHLVDNFLSFCQTIYNIVYSFLSIYRNLLLKQERETKNRKN